ncbi:MAG: hypothetical protein Q4D96_10875 [Propionibacteriaceae bacterium]|nr:hypothetical protein [Propionibacteriaceae bacterium]
MTILVTTPPHHAPSYVLDVCEAIAEDPSGSQLRALAIQTTEGIRFRNGVPGTGISVFWSLGDDGPRIEAVFPWSPSSR